MLSRFITPTAGRLIRRSLVRRPSTAPFSAASAPLNRMSDHETSTQAAGPTGDMTDVTQPDHGKTLPLPEPPIQATEGADAPTTLDVSGGGGGTVKLDHLGPLVVHQDGTMSRISNWAEMTDIERQNTLRILGKRNQLRLSNLRKGLEDGEDRTR